MVYIFKGKCKQIKIEKDIKGFLIAGGALPPPNTSIKQTTAQQHKETKQK